MTRMISLSPNRNLYSTEEFLNLNSINTNNDIIRLMPISTKKESHAESSVKEQANSSTLQRNKSFMSITESYYDPKDMSAYQHTKRTGVVLQRADSLSKLMRKKESLYSTKKGRNQMQAQSSTLADKKLSTNKNRFDLMGVAGMEYRREQKKKRKEKARLEKELKMHKEEQERKLAEERKKKEMDMIKNKMMFKEMQKVFKEKVEKTKQDLLDLNRLDSHENLEDLNAFDESEKDEDPEEESMKKLRKQILQEDSAKNVMLQKMISVTSDSTNLRTKTDQTLNLERNKSTEIEANKTMKKLAYAVTDDAIQKEKFFKIVKDVLRGSLMDKLLSFKYKQKQIDEDEETIENEEQSEKYSQDSQKFEMQNKVAQVKFINA